MIKTKEVNEKYMKEIYLNILKAIVIVLYFFVLNLSYENVRSEYLDVAIKVFTMAFLFISIYIFEKAYKKDDGNLAIQGIEVLLLATYTLTTEHIINKFKFNFKSYSLVASYLLATYFILKCIVIYTKGRKEIEEERSDVREIVKKSEPVKKESAKKEILVKKVNVSENESTTKKVKTSKIENETSIKKTKTSNDGNKTTTKKPKTSNDENKTIIEKVNISNEDKKIQTKKSNTLKEVETKSTKKKASTKIQSKPKTENKVSNTKTKSKPKAENKVSSTKTQSKSKTENKVENKKTTTKNKENVIKQENQEEKPKRKRVKKEVTEND